MRHVEQDRLLPALTDHPHYVVQVLDNPRAGRLDTGPHPEVVRAIPDDERPGVREQLQVIPNLPRPVPADLTGDAPVGDPRSRRFATPLEELRISAIGPTRRAAEVVPSGDAVPRAHDIHGHAARPK